MPSGRQQSGEHGDRFLSNGENCPQLDLRLLEAGFGQPMQVPGARDVAVEFFTMSKSYNMAGWRIGFMVGNKDLVHALARIKRP